MPTMNKMSDLCDKIERRLGTKPLNLPADVAKDTWPSVIEHDSIDTFSRYFPRRIKVVLTEYCLKDGWYYFDQFIPANVEILGVADLNWEDFASDTMGAAQCSGYGFYDVIAAGGLLGPIDIMSMQAAADHASIYNNGIYVETELPNKVRFKNVSGGVVNINNFPIDVLVKHAPNLMTISPTMMETFERLALADVASYLYEYLKYYDGVDTVFANIDFKIDSLASKAQTREDVVQELKDAYVSFNNSGQMVVICQ